MTAYSTTLVNLKAMVKEHRSASGRVKPSDLAANLAAYIYKTGDTVFVEDLFRIVERANQELDSDVNPIEPVSVIAAIKRQARVKNYVSGCRYLNRVHVIDNDRIVRI